MTENQDLRNDKNWKEKAPYGLNAENGFPITKEEHEAIRQNGQQRSEVIKISVSSSEMKSLIESNLALQKEKEQLQKEIDESVKPIPAGTIPLSTQQSSSNPQIFENSEQLIDNVRDRASVQNPDKQDRAFAKAVLDKMMLKAFSGQKDCGKKFDYTMEKDVSINDVLNAKYQRRKKLAKGGQ